VTGPHQISPHQWNDKGIAPQKLKILPKFYQRKTLIHTGADDASRQRSEEYISAYQHHESVWPVLLSQVTCTHGIDKPTSPSRQRSMFVVMWLNAVRICLVFDGKKPWEQISSRKSHYYWQQFAGRTLTYCNLLHTTLQVVVEVRFRSPLKQICPLLS